MSDTYRPGGYQGYEGYGSLDWRRRIALEMMKKQRPYPKNVGEGIASAGGDLADALIAKQQREDEQKYQNFAGGVGRVLSPTADAPYASPRSASAAAPTPSIAGAGSAGPNYFAGFPNSLSEQLDRDPYGIVPSFNDASEGQPAPMPTTAPAATGEKVPLPPERPVYDRNRQIAEIEADPTLKPRLLAMARGEVGDDPAKQRVQLETAFNRAAARDQPLSQILLDTGTNKRLGYYPPETFMRGQASPDVLTPVLRGSDEGGQALGFSPTGNASEGVAARGAKSGYYTNYGQLEPGTVPGQRGIETFVQHQPDNIARLEASRVPGSPRNILPQAAGGIESGPRTFGGPYTQAAPAPAPSGEVPFLSAGGLPARDAITSAMVPPPTPPVQTAALPSATATDAAPERAALPPDATAQVQPKNPIITTDAVKKMLEPKPSEEPIPQASPPYVTKIRPEPKRPQPLAMSDAQARAAWVMNHPGLDPQGPEVRRATQIYNFQEGLRKELEGQQQADYVNDRAKWDAEKVLAEKRAFEEPGKILEEHVKRVGVEKAQSDLEEAYYKRGIPREQARVQADLDIAKAQQTVAAGVAPKTEVDPRTGRIQMWNQKTGKMEDAAPDVKPEHLKLTEGEQKSLNYFVNSHLASTQLGDQKALVGLGDFMKGRVPVFGNNWVSPEYRQIKSAADAWIMNTLRSQSGAAIRPEETKDYYAIYFPMFGDRPIDIAAKAARRKGQEESLKASLGPVRPLAEQFEAKRETQRAPPEIPHGKIQQSPSTGMKRVNIHGYWEPIP